MVQALRPGQGKQVSDTEEEDLRSQITWDKLGSDVWYLRRNNAFPYFVLDRQKDMGKTVGWSVTRMGRSREHVGTKTRLASAKRLAEDSFVGLLHSRHEIDRINERCGPDAAGAIAELQETVHSLSLRLAALEAE